MKGRTYQDIMISASELEIGMQVVKLDRPWEETSFLLQSFIIKSKEEIFELQEQCNHVWVQVRIDQVDAFNHKMKTKRVRPRKTTENQGPSSTTRVSYINRVGFDEAVEASRMTFKSARSLATGIMDGLRVGKALDINQCRDAVEDIVDKVLDNRDALKFLSLIKNKDSYTAEHSMNVCILCATFARHLGLLEYEIKLVALCGLLHDVGKSRIPNEILNKPGRLTAEEAHLMAEHPNHGRNILMSIEHESRQAVDVAHSHHERIDGRGYPRSLKSHQISYYAKIVTIVDAYDAMTSNRSYGIAKSSAQALKIILAESGAQFDGNLAQEFVQCIGLYSAGCLVELESGQIAFIVRANDENRLRPRLLILTDKHRKMRDRELPVNLEDSKYQSIHIKAELANGTAGIDVKEYINRLS